MYEHTVKEYLLSENTILIHAILKNDYNNNNDDDNNNNKYNINKFWLLVDVSWFIIEGSQEATKQIHVHTFIHVHLFCNNFGFCLVMA